MFSGIVEDIGKVVSVSEDSSELVIESSIFSDRTEVKVGDSVCVSGVCLTVTALNQSRAHFDLASETRRCTNLGKLVADANVNLERSLRIGDRLHGHFVSGHVDDTAPILSIEERGNTWRFEIALSPTTNLFLVPKGGVCLEGVSLTVGEVSNLSFSVYIIPHTFRSTSFCFLRVGQLVNVEIDMLARYVRGRIDEA